MQCSILASSQRKGPQRVRFRIMDSFQIFVSRAVPLLQGARHLTDRSRLLAGFAPRFASAHFVWGSHPIGDLVAISLHTIFLKKLIDSVGEEFECFGAFQSETTQGQ